MAIMPIKTAKTERFLASIRIGQRVMYYNQHIGLGTWGLFGGKSNHQNCDLRALESFLLASDFKNGSGFERILIDYSVLILEL